ncbi:sensor histidine kinase [Chitinophaga solisilvae]|uniref:Histidine kinase n=1 Tax=Chitinophaga solisilvae TaxID=1233460 RepID=A0A3S1D404_9BACT|nr:histidine kinase [Chitinophaga solisilvae]NSL86272.1 histidine kinase [Chitinophaga solisilvae]
MSAAEQEKWYHRNFFVEVVFFISMYVLTMLHEMMLIDTFTGFIKGLVFFLILYAQAQFHRFFVFPLVLEKKYLRYALFSFISTLLGAVILFVPDYYWIDPYYQDENITLAIIYHFALCVISTTTIMSFFLIRKYSIALRKKNEAQLLLNEMNIKFLHAQMNPHFFFNTFNNLYGVSLTAPQRVPELILKLSNLMRYQLENGRKTAVGICEEISFIEDYIIMEKERTGKRCEIVFHFTPPHETACQYRIAPMMLIALVENAFKHSLTILHKWFVHIHIEVNGHMLCMRIINSVGDESLRNYSTGIGLMNIRERLELLYKGRYQYDTTSTALEYQTTLTLQLNPF